MTQNAMPTFTFGGDEADAQDQAKPKGGNFRRAHYFEDPGDGGQVLLRYITDFHAGPQGWLPIQHHNLVPTKPKPADYPSEKWPSVMPAICRYDKAFRGDPAVGRPAVHTDCWVCDTKPEKKWGGWCKPTPRVFAIACLREEVLGTDEMVAGGRIPADMVGKRVGFKNKTREVTYNDKDGNEVTKQELALVVIQKSMTNYFGGLLSIGRVYGTVCDRDYIVQQKGVQKDIEFHHIAMEPGPLKPGTDSWKQYEEALTEQNLSLPDIVVEQASDEWYAKWFDPTKTFKWASGKGSKDAADAQTGSSSSSQASSQQASGGQQSVGTNEVDQDRLRAMTERIRGNSHAKAQETASAPQGDSAPPEQQQAASSAPVGMQEF